MENKITAVEWLILQIKNDHIDKVLTGLEWMKVFEQAKQMEWENLMDEYYRGYNDGYANGQMDLITN